MIGAVQGQFCSIYQFNGVNEETRIALSRAIRYQWQKTLLRSLRI